MSHRFPIVLAPAVLSALLVGAGPAQAQDTDDLIKYRRTVMKASGAHMASMAAIVRGKVDQDAQLAGHARAVNDLAGMTADLFPEGSDFGDTEAKEAIWEDPEAFAERIEQQRRAAAALVDAIGAGDEAGIDRRFRDLSKACKACHKKFRAEEE